MITYKYEFTFACTLNGLPCEDIQVMSSSEAYTLETLQPEIEFRLQGYRDTGWMDVRIRSVIEFTITPNKLL